MKIAISTLVTPSLKIGVGEYLRNLILHLQQLDQVNEYYIFTSKDTRSLFPLTNKNFFEIPSPIPQNAGIRSTVLTLLWIHTFFLSACRRLGIDMIHIPNTQLNCWLQTPLIATIHDLGEWHVRNRFGRFRTRYRKIANIVQAKYAKKIITISESSKKDICRYLGTDSRKVVVIYEGAAEAFREKIGKDEALQFVRKNYAIDGGYLLYVGSVKKHKNITGIIKAMALLKRQQGISCRLLVVGKKDNAYEELKKTISDLKLTKEVFFSGYVRDEELPYLYRAAKMLVYPSLWEGFGIPVVEAMSCACPVVCSHIASLPEVAGNAAVYVDPHNISAISNAILSIFENPELEGSFKKSRPPASQEIQP